MKKRGTTRLLCLVLTILMFVPSLSFLSFADKTERSSNENFGLDFSDSRLDNNKKLSPSKLLSMLVDESICQEESEYLDSYFDEVFLYNDFVTAKNFEVSFTSDEGRYLVSARAKRVSYTAKNGTLVEWIPTFLTLGSEKEAFVLSKTGDYECSMELSSSPYGEVAKAEYSCKILLPKDTVNSLLNFAYNDANQAIELAREYSDTLGSYSESLKAYREYLNKLESYEGDLAAYEEYLVVKAEYDKEYAKYADYLSKLAAYEQERAKYDKYNADHNAYIEAKANYETEYAKYLENIEKHKKYIVNSQKINSAMTAMEALFISPSSKKTGTLFNALQNAELVAMFEKYKDKLVSLYGVKEADINDMRKVSDELNELLRGYSEARKISKKEAFTFYSKNYEEITFKFNYLYEKLTLIMTRTLYNHMCGLVELEYENDKEMASYKKWRIKNVLCHIYIISNCLDDEKNLAGKFDFYSDTGAVYSYYFSDLLDTNLIIADHNAASPENLKWMDEVKEGIPPEMPIPPTPVDEPVPPTKVNEPKDVPMEVQKPTKPTAVLPPEAPSEEKKAFVNQAEEIVNAFNNGKIKARNEYVSDVELILKASAMRTVRESGERGIYFISFDGSVYSDKTFDGEITLPPEAPEREKDEAYEYRFLGWSYSPYEMQSVSLTRSVSDVYLYALYEKTPRSYEVTFKSEGKTVLKKTYLYGEIPDITDISHNFSKEDTADATYSLAGFYPQIRKVTKDTVYNAIYTSSHRMYKITFDVLGEKTEKTLPYGVTPQPPIITGHIYKGSFRYSFKGWDKSISAVSSDAEYTALFDSERLISPVISGETEDTAVVVGSLYDYTVMCNGIEEIEFSTLLKLAKNENKRLQFVYNGAEIIFPEETVKAFERYGIVSFKLSESNNGIAFSLIDYNGESISPPDEIKMRLVCSDEQSNGAFVFGSYFSGATKKSSCIVNEGFAEFVANANVYYKLKRQFTVNISPSKNGAVFINGEKITAGEAIPLVFHPNSEYFVSKIIITNMSDNTKVELDSLEGYLMPYSDIEVSIIFERRTYTVSFVCHGETVSTEKYYLGDIPDPPDVPSSYEEDGYIYTFTGWSPTVVGVTEDTVYSATYYREVYDANRGSGEGNALRSIIIGQILPMAIGILLLSGGITFIAVKRHKKKKLAKSNTEKKDIDNE
ncbi:MAG: hypothetical protein J6Q78_01760 [Clostridia bacterium]|nr:hypothetical protein [Clostridia bacterium]